MRYLLRILGHDPRRLTGDLRIALIIAGTAFLTGAAVTAVTVGRTGRPAAES